MLPEVVLLAQPGDALRRHADDLVPQLKGLKLIFAIAVLAGAVILVIGFTTNGGIYKAIGKNIIKHATVGFYLVVVGIVAAVVGALKKA